MALQAPVDREFAILSRGFVRDHVVLANFREGLRSLKNPETGLPFTEDEIQRATQPKSRWYNEAQAIDDFGQSEQRKALFLADQLRIERASTKWLVDFHGKMWGEDLLDPTGGSGAVRVTGVPGTIVVGSTTLGDPIAHKARDAAGNQYQVLIGGTIDVFGVVSVQMIALGTGAATNLLVDTVLTWTFRDPNMEAQATVLEDFRGGTDQETNAEFAARLLGLIRHKQGAGNDSQTRAWTRKASNAIEDGFVYSCAFHAGSVLIAITQKRGNASGPLARLASPGTLAAAIAYMTPPGSAVYPAPPHVLVCSAQSQSSDVTLELDLLKGSAAGWTDAQPFPKYDGLVVPTVTNIVSPTVFDVTSPADATLPSQLALATLTGSNCPRMMLWHQATSRFDSLSISQIVDQGSNVFRVTLTGAPVHTVAIGQVVSPEIARETAADQQIVSRTIEEYFDELGPTQLFDTTADPRGSRCVRFPRVTEERPFRAGSAVATRVMEALGGTSADAIATLSRVEPDFPTTLTNGPNMLTLGKVGCYPLS